ncbi:MAG TPA: TonB-dependent receptor [Nitrospiraceae bacterium]|nr:TonB-dependent receptor [Nitrospiraceae bacterium]
MPNIAHHFGSLWTTYEMYDGRLKGFGAGVGVFAAGKRAGDLNNSFELPGYVRVDAALYYRKPEVFSRTNLVASLNFRNLFDTQYYDAAQNSRVIIYPGAPFTVLGSIRLEYF